MAASFGPGRLHQSRSKSRMARSRRERPIRPPILAPRAAPTADFPSPVDRYAGRSDYDAADDLARLHRPERVVDLVEVDVARHHRADVEPTGLHQLDVAGEVTPDSRRAVEAAEQGLVPSEEPHGGEGDGVVHARHPDDDGGAAGA